MLNKYISMALWLSWRPNWSLRNKCKSRVNGFLVVLIPLNPVAYLVVLWGDRWRWWRDFRLALRVAVVCRRVGWLVRPISRGRYRAGRHPSNTYRACTGRVRRRHAVCRHRCLMNCVAGHRGRMRVGHPGSWLLTGRAREKHHMLAGQSKPCWCCSNFTRRQHHLFTRGRDHTVSIL